MRKRFELACFTRKIVMEKTPFRKRANILECCNRFGQMAVSHKIYRPKTILFCGFNHRSKRFYFRSENKVFIAGRIIQRFYSGRVANEIDFLCLPVCKSKGKHAVKAFESGGAPFGKGSKNDFCIGSRLKPVTKEF